MREKIAERQGQALSLVSSRSLKVIKTIGLETILDQKESIVQFETELNTQFILDQLQPQRQHVVHSLTDCLFIYKLFRTLYVFLYKFSHYLAIN